MDSTTSQRVLAVRPDGVAQRATFKTVMHASSRLRRTLPKVPKLRHSSWAAWRTGMVAQDGARPVHNLACCRKKKGLALGLNKAQIECAIAAGVWPLNSNKLPSSKHSKRFKKLYALAKKLPFEKAFSQGRGPTEQVRCAELR